jgi:glycosyltransferase involved in cell wall biosynthesis
LNLTGQTIDTPPAPILVLGEYGTLNGGERSFLTVCKSLQARGWKFIAAVPQGSEFEAAFARQQIPNLGYARVDEDGLRLDQQGKRQQLSRLIFESKPAIVHANSLSMSRICGPVAAELGVPSVGYLRDILKLSKKAVGDINQLDRIVAVSNATADWHVGQGMDRSRVGTIYNGVDGTAFRPFEAEGDRAEIEQLQGGLGIEAADRVILYVGQIGMRKGIDSLAEVFVELAQQISNVHLLIVGERNSTKAENVEYEQRIKRQLSATRFSKQVHWLGRRSDVAKLMRLADLLLHPARQEPLGRVLLEASSAGLPIVTTDVGGSAEILPAETPLFDPDDVAGMAGYACNLLRDEKLRFRVGTDQRKAAQSRFSVVQCTERLERVYRELLGAT